MYPVSLIFLYMCMCEMTVSNAFRSTINTRFRSKVWKLFLLTIELQFIFITDARTSTHTTSIGQKTTHHKTSNLCSRNTTNILWQWHIKSISEFKNDVYFSCNLVVLALYVIDETANHRCYIFFSAANCCCYLSIHKKYEKIYVFLEFTNRNAASHIPLTHHPNSQTKTNFTLCILIFKTKRK